MAKTKDIVGFRPEPSTVKKEPLQRGKNWLFLIAIKEYTINPLNNCVRDAEALRKVLQKQYKFEESETINLYNKDATITEIYRTFEDLINNNKIGEHDNLIIFYSGHGEIRSSTKSFCWVTIQSEEDNDYSKAITKDAIIGFLNNIKARHIFLIVDSCFSGTILDPSRYKSGSVQNYEEDRSRLGLTSGRRNEKVQDDGIDGHSPFAKSLIDTLKANHRPLRVGELAGQVIDKVAKIKNVKQKPSFERLEVLDHDGGQMVLHPRRPIEDIQVEDERGPEVDMLAHLPVRKGIGHPKIPFKGLRWFEEKDARVFFGRKREIRDLYQTLENRHDLRKRLVLLYGPSGAGKSSLLFAGLKPRVPEEWQIVYKRRGQHGNALEILKAFRSRKKSKSVLILDQLEELFSNPGDSGAFEVEKFSGLLFATLEKYPNLSIVLGFREEYLKEVETLIDQPDSFTKMVLNHLDKTGLIEALSGVASPPANTKYKDLKYIDSDLPRIIADDFLSLGTKTYTPLVQYLLSKMWDAVSVDKNGKRKRKKPYVFTRALYQDMQKSSLMELLESQLEEVGATFPVALSNGLLNDILFLFVTADRTSRARALDELKNYYHHIHPDTIDHICRALSGSHLLTKFTDKKGQLYYRLSHDTLAPYVWQRFNESEAEGQQANRYLEHALKTGTALPKKAVLTIKKGKFGRKALSDKEDGLLKEAWEANIKSLVRDEMNRNRVEDACKLLQDYLNLFQLGGEGYLYQNRYNYLKRERNKGTVSMDEFFREKGKLRDDINSYLNNMDFEKRKKRLLIFIDSLHSENIDEITKKANDFMAFEKLDSIVKIRDRITLFEELWKDLVVKGVIDLDDFLQQFSEAVRTIIMIVLDNYFYTSIKFNGLLSLDDIISINRKGILRLYEVNRNNLDQDKISEKIGQYLDQISADKKDQDKITFFWLAVSLFNWVYKSNEADLIYSGEETTIQNRLFYSLELLIREPSSTITIPTKLKEDKAPVFIMDLLCKNNLIDAIDFMEEIGVQASEYKFPIFKEKTSRDAIEMGLYLLSFDKYRFERNADIYRLIKLLNDKYGFLTEDFEKDDKYEPYCREVMAKMKNGKLSTALGAIEQLLEEKYPDIEVCTITASIENEILKMYEQNQIKKEDYDLWKNIVINMIVQYCDALWSEDKIEKEETVVVDFPVNITLKSIKEKVYIGETATALEYFIKFLSHVDDLERVGGVALLKYRFNSLKNKQQKKIIRYKDYKLELNRITFALLEIINELSSANNF